MAYDCLLNLETRPLTPEETRVFLSLMMADAGRGDPQKIAAMDTDFLVGEHKNLAYNIIRDRLGDRSRYVSVPLRVWLMSICKTPGEAVMWAYTLVRLLQKMQDAGVELADSCLGISGWTLAFPMGIPTEQAYHLAWDAQKGFAMGSALDNWLDDPANW